MSDSNSDSNTNPNQGVAIRLGKDSLLNNDKYRMVKYIGSGRFSRCWECCLFESDPNDSARGAAAPCAIKLQRTKEDYYLDMAKDEIKFYTHLANSKYKSKHLLTLQDHFIEKSTGQVCMVFEKMDKTLHKLISETRSGLSVKVTKSIIAQILKGVECLHRNGIVHTDLKPENILIKELPKNKSKSSDGNEDECNNEDDSTESEPEYLVKISDLGNACFAKDIERKARLEKEFDIERYLELVDDDSVEQYRKLHKKGPAGRTSSETKRLLRLLSHKSTRKDINEYNNLVETKDVREYKELDEHIMDSIGTTEYNSLESIICAGYGRPTDLWSVACIVFECLTDEYLFDPHAYSEASDSESESESEFGSDSGSDSGSESEFESESDSENKNREYNKKRETESEVETGNESEPESSSDSDSGSDSNSEGESDSSDSSDSDDEDDRIETAQMHLWLITRALGEIPKRLAQRGDFFNDFFRKSGRINEKPEFLQEPKSISYQLAHKYGLDAQDSNEVGTFLAQLLIYNPERRVTAEKALQLEWMHF